MADATQFLPTEYGYVALVLVFYCFLNFWMGFQVGAARKKYFLFFFNYFLTIFYTNTIFCSEMNLIPISSVDRYKVPYPTLYAVESENKDAKLFNCVQVNLSFNFGGSIFLN